MAQPDARPPYLQRAQMIKQGAEARVYRSSFLGRSVIIKERFPKLYRHPEVDEKLSRRRTIQEVRSIQRCRRAGIGAPAVYFVDLRSHCIFLEDVCDAVSVRDRLRGGVEDPRALAEQMGRVLALMHNEDVIHGDLTTSNMLLRGPELLLLDFGLSGVSALAEDKAVDLLVLERALLSSHPGSARLLPALLHSYSATCRTGDAVLRRLNDARQRGRKRSMLG